MEDEHFDAAQFRRSAAMLDDEFGNDNENFSARPPTMIARRMAQGPVSPVTYGNYPTADPYTADPYAAGQQFHVDPYNQYNAYPAYTQEPAYGLNPGDTFPSSNPIVHSDSASSSGEMDPTTAHNTYLNRQPTFHDAHPDGQQYLNMNRVASPTASAESFGQHPAEYGTGLMSPTSATPLHNPHDSIPATPLRNPHDTIGYPSLGSLTGPGPAAVDHSAVSRRPDTVYDDEDAYGGM